MAGGGVDDQRLEPGRAIGSGSNRLMTCRPMMTTSGDRSSPPIAGTTLRTGRSRGSLIVQRMAVAGECWPGEIHDISA